jgi:hypothetical protein
MLCRLMQVPDSVRLGTDMLVNKDSRADNGESSGPLSPSLLLLCSWGGPRPCTWFQRMFMRLHFDQPSAFLLRTNLSIQYPFVRMNLFQSSSFLRIELKHSADDMPGFPRQKSE